MSVLAAGKRNVVRGHRITWWVYAWNGAGDRAKLRHTAMMQAGWVAWDASCECGWESRTGGATRGSVERDVRDHKFDVTGEVWRLV